MAENTGNSKRPTISRLNCPPFIAVELSREDMGIHPCDRRRSISEYKSMFPAIDFSLGIFILKVSRLREVDTFQSH
ncbi:hypothetical protein Hdeb2414_s0026g00683781 [Helianthus debilis subsp. tardiflorus]